MQMKIVFAIEKTKIREIVTGGFFVVFVVVHHCVDFVILGLA